MIEVEDDDDARVAREMTPDELERSELGKRLFRNPSPRKPSASGSAVLRFAIFLFVLAGIAGSAFVAWVIHERPIKRPEAVFFDPSPTERQAYVGIEARQSHALSAIGAIDTRAYLGRDRSGNAVFGGPLVDACIEYSSAGAGLFELRVEAEKRLRAEGKLGRDEQVGWHAGRGRWVRLDPDLEARLEPPPKPPENPAPVTSAAVAEVRS